MTLWLLWLRGWDPVAQNLKSGRWELDLVLIRGSVLKFVEVKFRSPGAWTSADTALSYGQRLRLQQAARTYLDRVPWPGEVVFQRVSWAGWRCVFHPPERWDGLNARGAGAVHPS